MKIVEAGLACVPAKSQFAECIRDTVRWWKENPKGWQKTWQLIEEKYQLNPANRKFSCSGANADFNIDAKINAAYIIMGLLYGDRKMEDTIVISMRCGQDSDCNPSNAGGVLGTTMGKSKMAPKFVSELNPDGVFSHTAYSFPALVKVCEELARQAVVKYGGRIEKTDDGDVFVIPVQEPKPSKLEQCWEPRPAANSRFTEEEMKQIDPPANTPRRTQSAPKIDISEAVAKFAPGWTVSNCGDAMVPGLRASFRDKSDVLVTHPKSQEIPCALTRTLEIPAGKKTVLTVVVAHDERGDWVLTLQIDGQQKHNAKTISSETCPDGWCRVEFDLSDWAGKTVPLELRNQANGWSYEAGYWAEIAIDSE